MNKKLKICLTTCVDKELENSQMFGVKYLPVWSMTLIPYIQRMKEFEPILFDSRVQDFGDLPKADIYFISGINQDFSALEEYRLFIKNKYPNAITVIGGPITYSMHIAKKIHSLNAFDSIFIGNGESSIEEYLTIYLEKGKFPDVYHSEKQFKLSQAVEMNFDQIESLKNYYYGGVVEVSRGCPFLCEFCDIRTLPNNNLANNKSIPVIIKEVEKFCELGMHNILFACDNFIGDMNWAEELCDSLIEFRQKTGKKPSFYTWLTINVSFNNQLLKKLRLAGFEMFFIGIESFGKNQLLETAKVQNTNLDLKEAIFNVQSYGFVVVAGIIFGFDSDTKDVVDETLHGIESCGLISGDPSLLTALPGTPLYKRMQLAGRLRDGKLGLGGHKYHTNIKYLQPKNQIIENFIYFVKEFNKSQFQLARFTNFLNNSKSDNFIASDGEGYINIGSLKNIFLANRRASLYAIKRLLRLLRNPNRAVTVLVGLFKVLRMDSASVSIWGFWIFNWSNSLLKYSHISSADFDIESIGKKVELSDILPEDYISEYGEPIPLNKIKAQRRITSKALLKTFKDYYE